MKMKKYEYMEKLAEELTKNLSEKFDILIVNELVELFKNGTLILEATKPDFEHASYPLTSTNPYIDTFWIKQGARIRFLGDEKIQELEQKIENMKCCGNCKHEDSTFNCSLDEYCQDKDKWELKQ